MKYSCLYRIWLELSSSSMITLMAMMMIMGKKWSLLRAVKCVSIIYRHHFGAASYRCRCGTGLFRRNRSKAIITVKEQKKTQKAIRFD